MPPASPSRTARIDMRTWPDLRQRIVQIARNENRTVSNWIEEALEAAVAEHTHRRNELAR